MRGPTWTPSDVPPGTHADVRVPPPACPDPSDSALGPVRIETARVSAFKGPLAIDFTFGPRETFQQLSGVSTVPDRHRTPH